MHGQLSVLLAACAVTISCSPSHRATLVTAPPPAGTELPLTMVMELPATTVTIGDHPVKLIVDTGGHDTLTLEAEAIERLGGAVNPGVRGSFAQRADGDLEFNRQLSIPTVRLGEIELRDVEGSEIDFGGPDLLEQATDGYLGHALLRRFQLLVDEPDRLVLFPAGAPPEALDLAAWTPVSISKHLHTKVLIAGEELTALFDTGANHTVIDPGCADRLFGAGTEDIVSDVTIAGRTIPELRLTRHDLSGARVDLILGTNFFRRQPVLFDFAEDAVWLAPPR